MDIQKTAYFFAITTLCCFWACRSDVNRPVITYPQTPKSTVQDTFHDIAVSDPYRWLEHLDSSSTKTWIQDQDSMASTYMDALPQRTKIAERLAEINEMKAGYSGLPRKANGYYFFSSRQLKPTGLYRQKIDSDRAELLLDFSSLTDKSPDMRVVEFEPSPDGRYLAFGTSLGNSQWNTWYILDAENGEWLDDKIEGLYLFYSQISWTKDSRGFFYGGFEAPKAQSNPAPPRGHAVKYHTLNTSQSLDAIIHADTQNPGWIFRGQVTDDGAYYVFHTVGLEVNNVYYRSLTSETAAIQTLFDGRAHRFQFLGNVGSYFYFATSRDAPNRRIVKVHVDQPDSAHWSEIVAEKAYPINSAKLLGGQLIVEYLKDVSPKVDVYNLEGKQAYTVELPYVGGWIVSRRSTGFMTSFVGTSDDNEAFFGMTGQTDPGTIYRLDVKNGAIHVHSRPEIAFDPNDFTVKQVFYPSKDGTRIPMFLVYKTDLFHENQAQPTWLYAYGYNFPSTLYYLNNIIVWMEMGGIYAYPGIRGGSDYGQDWIAAGAGPRKQTAIDDYIWAGKWLVDHGYTRSDILIANGGSASGPLPAAAINQSPSSFGLAFVDIPLLDMVRMYDYISGITTTGWGDRNAAEDFEALIQWSPYHNVKEQPYPPVIVAAGEKDQLAVPLHAYKYVAALQDAQQDKHHPIFLQVSWDMGHNISNAVLINQLAFAAEWFGMQL